MCVLVMLLCCFCGTMKQPVGKILPAEASLAHLTDDHLLSEHQIPKSATFTVNKEHNWINKILNCIQRTGNFQNKFWL